MSDGPIKPRLGGSIYHIAAAFELPADHHQEFIVAALEDGRESAANESETLRFELIKDSDHPNRFYLNRRTRTRCLEAHYAGPYFRRFFETVRFFPVSESP